MRIGRLIPMVSVLALAAYGAGCGLTPEAIDAEQLAELTAAQANRVVMDQEPLSGPVSLYEAMARALKYNLDYKVEMMQEQLRGGELIMASTELLPRAEATSGHSERNNYLMSGELDRADRHRDASPRSSRKTRSSTSPISRSAGTSSISRCRMCAPARRPTSTSSPRK